MTNDKGLLGSVAGLACTSLRLTRHNLVGRPRFYMVERIFDRAFNKVLFDKKRAEEGFEAERPRSKSELEAREADRIRREAAPMTTSDAIKRMLLAYKDKDYFRFALHTTQPQGIEKACICSRLHEVATNAYLHF